jgi:hypothetical protein
MGQVPAQTVQQREQPGIAGAFVRLPSGTGAVGPQGQENLQQAVVVDVGQPQSGVMLGKEVEQVPKSTGFRQRRSA